MKTVLLPIVSFFNEILSQLLSDKNDFNHHYYYDYMDKKLKKARKIHF